MPNFGKFLDSQSKPFKDFSNIKRTSVQFANIQYPNLGSRVSNNASPRQRDSVPVKADIARHTNQCRQVGGTFLTH